MLGQRRRTAHVPEAQGLYDPRYEHDACGIGFVCNVNGHPSHDVVQRGIQVLINLTHRGAAGSDPETGDGAGIVLQVPHRFLHRECAKLGIRLPAAGEYGVGMLFLPRDPALRARCESAIEQIAKDEGQRVLGWRTVPVHPEAIGENARSTQPDIRQIFLLSGAGLNADAFERKLYLIRRLIERDLGHDVPELHIASLSSRTLCYKGLLLAHQIKRFFPDLADPEMESALALVHQRYSTNTWPTWTLAQPFRYLCHNGEINTLRGNLNWMNAREPIMQSDVWGDDLQRLLPILDAEGSDSAVCDSALEFLVLSGRSLPHAVMMLIPEAWEGDPLMDAAKRAFYRYHSCMMEPWDGPASIAFTDGRQIGAVLDRNGLRPSRYWITKDNFVVMASETGVLPIDPSDVAFKGRLQPGRMLLIDTGEGCIIGDAELKHTYAAQAPYAEWLRQHMVRLADLGPDAALAAPAVTASSEATPGDRALRTRQQMFGYTLEELRILLAPMATDASEAVGSMGNDTPLACLSDRPARLYSYFKQTFAQVTNPAIDSIREESVMSLKSTLGQERNLLAETPAHAQLLELDHPVLLEADMAKIRAISRPGLRAATIDATFAHAATHAEAHAHLQTSLDRLLGEAADAVRGGATILILSDRAGGRERIPMPALLAVSAVHHHLIREGLRMRCGLVVETGEAREVAHFALLVGYGAAAIHPYLALETIADLVRDGTYVPSEMPVATAHENYRYAIGKGLLKIFAKMGISTLRSYRGAQIFEAIGIQRSVIDKYFTGTSSRIGGIDLGVIAEECRRHHAQAFSRPGAAGSDELMVGGEYQWRRLDGERHLFNPRTIHKLQHAVRHDSYRTYKEYAALVNDQSQALYTIRGLLEFAPAKPIPLEEVEPASEIMKRFCTGAMSFGSISAEAHETLAIAMNRIGAKSNCGEGGEDPDRFTPDENGDSRRSAIKQVASGRFGVTSWYLTNADELQIKISQGAKPGEGGQLPGHKVDRNIARVRHSTPGVGLISPPPHHDIYSIEDLAQLIHDLKNANPSADVSVKLVSVSGVGTIAAGVSKGHAETVLIVGHDGGTGASPQTSIKHAGGPWEIGLAETQQALVLNDLRGRIRVHVDGQLKTGRDVVIGALLGAEEFGFGTTALVAEGCIMMRVCHLNTCPVGVATQREDLRKKFTGKAEHVVRFFEFLAEEVREIMASLGVRRLEEMIGRTEFLRTRSDVSHWKLPYGLDLSGILAKPDAPESFARRRVCGQEHGLERALDQELLQVCAPAIQRTEPVEHHMKIRNVNRTVGTMLGHAVSKRHGLEGLPDNTIRLRFDGSAGQSFGAFVPHGITMTLVGDANDYIGKGLSGGRIIVYPHGESTLVAAENMIVGNVALYGATSGEAFFNGLGGERFAVRNSGAHAVVEGVGDHGCEYMTGGRVVVLGPTGRNFAAGMSGGIAYVYAPERDFEKLCNTEMVDLEQVTLERDQLELRGLIEQHFRHTRSRVAERILEKWSTALAHFVKVMPRDYRRALLELAEENGIHG
jgi:glutamate synthase domain-containing protein 2/glutamate synthase domain-containing protein 1/glutamate synthase domain-containing protein 3